MSPEDVFKTFNLIAEALTILRAAMKTMHGQVSNLERELDALKKRINN